MALSGMIEPVSVEMRVHSCTGEVQPGWVLVRLALAGSVYLGDAVGGPVRHQPLAGEQTLLLPVPQASGWEEEWRGKAAMVRTGWRPMPGQPGPGGLPGSAASGPPAFEVTAVVRLHWRLIREETVTWPATSPTSPPRHYLLPRVLAEGENTVTVAMPIGAHPAP